MLPITRVNLQSFCRACLRELFAAKEPTHEINGISANNTFPKRICNSCHLKIAAIKEFRRKTIFSTGILKLVINDKKCQDTKDTLLKYCRVCLKRQSNELHNIRNSEELCLGMLESTGIQIIRNAKHTYHTPAQSGLKDALKDDLRYPNALCKRCYATLKTFLEFSKISKQTAVYLENLLNVTDAAAKNYDMESMHDSKDKEEKLLNLININSSSEAVDAKRMQLKIYDCDNEANDDIEFKICQQDTQDFLNEDSDSISSFKSEATHINDNLEKERSSDEDNKPLATIKAQTLKSKLKCSECNLCFRKQYLYEAHIKSVHEGIENAFVCSDCEQSFANNKTLQRHISFTHNSNMKNKTFVCKYCDRVFKRNVRLKEHISTVHQKLKPYNCSICSKKFGTKNTLTRHEKNHSTQKPFSCEHCDKRYNFLTDLNVHKQRHTANPQLLCPICKRIQPNQAELSQHFKRHSKSYQCSTCGKIFKKMVNLREHVDTVHLKQKFHCRFCNLTFSARKSLKNHELCHSSTNGPENCVSCKLYFKSKHSLLIHLKKLHSRTMESKDESSKTAKLND